MVLVREIIGLSLLVLGWGQPATTSWDIRDGKLYTTVSGVEAEVPRCHVAEGYCEDSSCTVFGFPNSAKANCQTGPRPNCPDSQCSFYGDCEVQNQGAINHCFGNVTCKSGRNDCPGYGELCLEDGNSDNFKICAPGCKNNKDCPAGTKCAKGKKNDARGQCEAISCTEASKARCGANAECVGVKTCVAAQGTSSAEKWQLLAGPPGAGTNTASSSGNDVCVNGALGNDGKVKSLASSSCPDRIQDCDAKGYSSFAPECCICGGGVYKCSSSSLLCPFNQKCNVATGNCVPGCNSNADCGLGFNCTAGSCTANLCSGAPDYDVTLNGGCRECSAPGTENNPAGACQDSSCVVFGFPNSARANCHTAGANPNCPGSYCKWADPFCPFAQKGGQEPHCWGTVNCLDGTTGCKGYGNLCLEDGASHNFKICMDRCHKDQDCPEGQYCVNDQCTEPQSTCDDDGKKTGVLTEQIEGQALQTLTCCDGATPKCKLLDGECQAKEACIWSDWACDTSAETCTKKRECKIGSVVKETESACGACNCSSFKCLGATVVPNATGTQADSTVTGVNVTVEAAANSFVMWNESTCSVLYKAYDESRADFDLAECTSGASCTAAIPDFTPERGDFQLVDGLMRATYEVECELRDDSNPPQTSSPCSDQLVVTDDTPPNCTGVYMLENTLVLNTDNTFTFKWIVLVEDNVATNKDTSRCTAWTGSQNLVVPAEKCATQYCLYSLTTDKTFISIQCEMADYNNNTAPVCGTNFTFTTGTAYGNRNASYTAPKSAISDGDSVCFIAIGTTGKTKTATTDSSRWGWFTNFRNTTIDGYNNDAANNWMHLAPYNTPAVQKQYTMWQGAAKCDLAKGYKVGTVNVTCDSVTDGLFCTIAYPMNSTVPGVGTAAFADPHFAFTTVQATKCTSTDKNPCPFNAPPQLLYNGADVTSSPGQYLVATNAILGSCGSLAQASDYSFNLTLKKSCALFQKSHLYFVIHAKGIFTDAQAIPLPTDPVPSAGSAAVDGAPMSPLVDQSYTNPLTPVVIGLAVALGFAVLAGVGTVAWLLHTRHQPTESFNLMNDGYADDKFHITAPINTAVGSTAVTPGPVSPSLRTIDGRLMTSPMAAAPLAH